MSCLAQCFLVLHKTRACTRWCSDCLLSQPVSPGLGLITTEPCLSCCLLQVITAEPCLRCYLLQVPYSEHSSFPELKAFTHWLR